jgi:hypothetical protein
MYKCGWNGCEKAYGTLNHLNAHVTMQSHGQKRTPEGTSIIISYLCKQCFLAFVAIPSIVSEAFIYFYFLLGGLI